VDRLFGGVRRVADAGFGVLFVSHRLDEVRAITDRVTVLRDGERAVTAPTDTLSEDTLIAHILGRQLRNLYPSVPDRRGTTRLAVTELTGGGVQDFSFDVDNGEIVGLTGLLGMGFETIPYLLFGAVPADSGRVVVDGRELDLQSLTPREAIAHGLALLPANRQRYGGLATATIAENATLPTVGEFFDRGVLRRRSERRAVQAALRDYDVRPPEPSRSFGTLSGGNQQKVLVAKWFRTEPTVLLLHEPTQGVDIGARRQIFERIGEAAREGKSVIIASSEYEDLANLCDRVFVLRDGNVVAELDGTDLTENRIVECAYREYSGQRAPTGGGDA
jgi:ribose transport system ATP-binding protein